MFSSISKEQFKNYKKKGFNRIPLLVEASSDLDSPLSIFTKLANHPYSYLLESVEGGDNFGRYSIVGLPSKIQIKINKNTISIFENGNLKEKFDHQNPLDFIEEYINKFKVPSDLNMPRYSGGLAGYFGYETINYIEPRLAKDFLKDSLNVPDILLMLSDEIVVIDNTLGKLFIISYLDPSQDDAYEEGELRLNSYLTQLKSSPKAIESSTEQRTVAKSEFGEEAFKEAVSKAKDYIYEGDVMQVVLSQRMNQPYYSDPLTLYRALRSLNPSPYMFFYHMEDHFVVGASPEILVRLEDRKVSVRPIAGTRPRGKDENEDKSLEKDLLNDPKEIAEHVQLMDLGRNDIGRVSKQDLLR